MVSANRLKKSPKKQEINSLGPQDKHEEEWAEAEQGESVGHNTGSSRFWLPGSSKSGVEKIDKGQVRMTDIPS